MNLNLSIKDVTKIVKGKLVSTEKTKEPLIQNVIIDSRSPLISGNSVFFALKGNRYDGHQFCNDFITKGGKVVIVSKRQNLNAGYQIVVDNVLKALQQLAQYHRKQFDIPIIGITGSNGKTIVKEWLYHVLKDDFNICRSPKSYNSQIGVALSILQLNPQHQIGIFEAGISKPNEMDTLERMIQPTIGVFTGLGDAHQHNFESLEQKRKEKYKLFKNCPLVIDNTVNSYNLSSLPLSDSISLLNINIVFNTACIFADTNTLMERLKTLPKISMRLEKMEGRNGNVIINDAYSLDETSLEIGLKLLKTTAYQNQPKILFISPSKVFNITKNIIKLLNSKLIDKIVWIGPLKPPKIDTPIHYFSTVNEYKSTPITFINAVLLFTGSRSQKIEQLIPNFLIKNHITKLTINLNAVKHNLNYFKSKLKPNTLILAMVKAQSYGGGIVEMAKFLEQQQIDYLGVAYADEGVTLVKHQVSLPILVMNPEKDAFNDIIKHKLEPSIYSLNLLDEFIRFLILKGIKNYPIHIKLDTGMHRLGFTQSNIKELLNTLNTQPEVYVKSVFSHLAVADDLKEKHFTKTQIKVFKTQINIIKNVIGYDFIKHISNSSAIINFPNANFDMIRLGIGLYGLIENIENKTENAFSFTTQISQIKTVKKGESVGYSRAFVAKTNTKIAIVPVGYADGLRRELSQGKWQLFVNNKKAKILGNICMDMCMIDITHINCKVGDEVEVFGQQQTIFDMAKTLNTIPYEIISSISNRVHRIYVEE